MNYNLHTTPDDQLEARITAWVLGEASPFEIAELESLVAKSPELQLFLARTLAIHSLLQEAETTANTPSEDWKLPGKKRAKLSPILGDIHILLPEKESRVRRASFRAAWGIAAVFVVTFFSLRLLPRDYEAEAVIEIIPRERRIDPLGGTMREPSAMTPQFFGTEFEKIKSRNSLEKVIDDLDLTSRWNTDKETALKRLKDSVETENIRGTDLIAIRVRQPDEQEAKEITRAVTEGYRDYRNTLEEKQHELGLAEIRNAVRQQEDKVEERRKVLTTISRTKKIIYHGEPGVTGQSDSDESGIIAQREGKRDALERSIDTTDYVDAKQDFETDLALLEQMKIKLMTEEIVNDLPNESVVIHEDPAITGKKFPSNPLAALKKALAPETKPSAPLARAEMSQPAPLVSEPSGERIDIAGNTHTRDSVIRREVQVEPDKSMAESSPDAPADEAVVHIGGHVRAPGPQEFKEGLTLGDAVASAGGSNEFGSRKRVKLIREGQVKTYDLDNEQFAQIELQPNDTIEMPEKNLFGCGGSRNDLLEAPSDPPSELASKVTDFGDGDDLGELDWAGGTGGGGAPAAAVGQAASVYNGITKTGAGTLNLEASGEISNSAGVVAGGKFDAGGFTDSSTPSAPMVEADPFAAAEPAKGLAERGNRSGDAAIERNTIDAILNNPEGTAAPAKPAASAPAPAAAPASELSSLAQREIVRRQEALTEADGKILGGRDAYAKGDYGQAVDKYKEALQQLPESPATEDRRRSYTEHLNDASVARAQELRKIGKYDEARDLLEKAQTSAPGDKRVKDEIAFLDDPIRTSPALTYEHQKNVDEVRRKLHVAEGNYDLGKYDDAKKAYEDTLRIDPYNKAARRGMEKLAAAKSDYYRAAYDNTRSELLAEVDEAWELSVPAGAAEKEDKANEQADLFADLDAPAEIGATTRSGAASKLSVVREFEYPPEYEPVDSFADPAAPGEIASGRGLGFESKDSGKSRYAWWVGDESVKGKNPSQSDLFFAEDAFNVNSSSSDGFKMDLTEHITGFTGDANFDGFVDYGAPIAGEPKQVDITTKHVEITQANDAELGFDWIVSPFSQKGNIASGSVIPVTPATPTDFESSLTGGTLEVAPILGDIPVVGRLFREKQPSLIDLSEEIPAAQEPFSTFSLNISDASFQLALAAVEKGERPDPASIKPEQFYNAVDYGDPAPSSLEPVAAAIDQTAHPVIPGRNLVRVAIRTASTGRSAAQPLRLTLLVDQSGSMARADRRAAMNTALAQLATLLTENDQVTVIGFSRTPRLIADALPGNEAGKLPDLINPTASEGGTNLEQALDLSSELALRHKLDGAQNRIVLFTDGAANLGDADPDRLAERVKELRQQGLAFDIAGIGTNDTNDRLLSELARHGNGRYYLVEENTGASLAAQLAGAFRPAAENVKVQVKLNPERVGSYKLIGFEKDRLKTEDFHDDSVDAGELATDEAGVAIYQVETLPEGTGEIGEVSVRFRDTASGEMVERAWTIPHDPSTPAFDKAEPKTQLATLALLAAQKLQGGPLADAIRFPDHAETIAKLKQTYANDAKTQRMLTLIDALR